MFFLFGKFSCVAANLDERTHVPLGLGRACDPVLGILVANEQVKRHIQYAVRSPLAVHCNAVAHAVATGWEWFQIFISRYTSSRT